MHAARNTHQIVFIVLTSLVLSTKTHAPCSNLYGAEPCKFLPAPPGKTPHCAHPGHTYCEHPEHYPGQRIQYLIQKWRYDHSTFLRDETKEEFSSYFYPPPTYKYGPYSNNLKQDSYFPEPFYVSKASNNYQNYQSSSPTDNTYIPPALYHQQQNFTGYPDRRPPTQLLNYKYSDNIPPVQQFNGAPFTGVSQLYPYANRIWRRDGLLARKRRSEMVSNNLKKLKTIHRSDNTTSSSANGRKKRQAALIGETLCQSRSSFVMPRAALNNQGNWMYVVNMPELDNRYTQLVKSETCASQTCSGLCNLPLGYTSRCEQKYVQKRLVALEGGGNDLYNDVFWFPSCCVCTISNNN